MDTGQGWGSGINWEFGIDIYIPPCIKYWVGQKFPSDFSIKPESLPGPLSRWPVGSCNIAQGVQLRAL